MWLPTKYWILLVISLKNAGVLIASDKVTPSDGESSSRSLRGGEASESIKSSESTLTDYEIVGPAADEIHAFRTAFPQTIPHSENDRNNSYKHSESPRKGRGIEHYSNEINKYVKLVSDGLGTLLSSLSAMPGTVERRSGSESGEQQPSESQAKMVMEMEVSGPVGLVPVANSLLSKINKGFNYTNSISKYLSSVPALHSLTSTFTGALSSVQDYFRFIKPGTQWCGDGDRAKSFEDLGVFYKTDACCREHDRCPDFIKSGAEKHGLRNDGVFTKLHCDCDARFYQCLRSVYSPIALSTGFEYFNILKPTCFKKEYPVIGCNSFNNGKCVQHKLDRSQEKIWQWFDNKDFL